MNYNERLFCTRNKRSRWNKRSKWNKGPNVITEKESNNLQNNIFLIMQMFPNQDIVSCCKKLNVDPKKLGVEYDLIAKIRDWKINNLDLIDSE